MVYDKICDFFLREFEAFRDTKNDGILTSIQFYLGFVLFYIVMIKIIGPSWMKNRLPFNIKKIIIVYNAVQISLNLYLFNVCLKAYLSSPSIMCLDAPTIYIDKIKYYYFILKMFDCIETVFYVLRKSFRQTSFLHLYHHSSILLATWVGYRYYWVDYVYVVPLLNTPVHAIMFTYYLLTSINSKWGKNLTLKKSITIIQIIQLNIIMIYYLVNYLFMNCKGGLSTALTLIWVTQNLFMVGLFINFYVKNYCKNNNKKKF